MACLTITIITAHDNMKVFVSHGGLLIITEQIFHATLLLVLPIFLDQSRNAKFLEILGSGLILEWEELTADRIVKALIDFIHNPILFYFILCVCVCVYIKMFDCFQ